MPFRFVLLRRSPRLQLGLFCLGLFHLGLFCPPFFSHVIAPAFIQAMQDYTIRIRAISTTVVRLLNHHDYQSVLLRLGDKGVFERRERDTFGVLRSLVKLAPDRCMYA
jgi:hypothetical protein